MSDEKFIVENSELVECKSKKTHITVPMGVKIIKKLAFFSGCDEVETIELPSSVIEIELLAFSNLNVKKIIILGNKVHICDGAFKGCERLREVNIPNDSSYKFAKSMLLADVKKAFPWGERKHRVLWYSPTSTEVNLTLYTHTTEEIAPYAFSGCINLESVSISYAAIGEKAFEHCTKMRNLHINDKVKKIADNILGELKNNISVTCHRGSYAENYCKTHGMKYTFYP